MQNRRILDLEDERTRLQAQLKHAMSDSAMSEALQLARQKEQEVEIIKARTVATFKQLAAEKQLVEDEKRQLMIQLAERDAQAASSESPNTIPEHRMRGSTPFSPPVRYSPACSTPGTLASESDSSSPAMDDGVVQRLSDAAGGTGLYHLFASHPIVQS